MNYFGIMSAAVAAIATLSWSQPTLSAQEIKFGRTCVSTPNNASDVCVSFNGKTASSTYKHRKTIPTKGTHTGCSATATEVSCSGGTWNAAGESGQMGPVTIKLSKGKPVSMSWGR
jgi:hypothetical protein